MIRRLGQIVLALAVAPGVTIRSAVHSWVVVLLTDDEPDVDREITFQNVAGVDDFYVDWLARAATVAFGAGWLLVMPPMALDWSVGPTIGAALSVYVALNQGILLGEPLWLLLGAVTERRSNTTETPS